MKREVLRPLEKFSESVNKVSRSGIPSSRLSVVGEDELSDIAVSVNNMLDKLEQSQNNARDSERMAGIGQTATMVAHDLRNPLQVIVNLLYMAKQNTGALPIKYKESAEKIEENLNGIDSQIQYMDKIVLDLHFYGTALTSKVVETSIVHLINNIIMTMNVPENIKISVEKEEDFPNLMLDPTLIRQIFANLITNALQAMPKGGILTIRLFKAEDNAYIKVQDTGVGIPEQYLDKIFEPLFTTKSKGQGLGLKVCKKLIESQNGTISVESQENKGTTFTVKLPIRR
jgi:signal transduction histidine kinase